MTKRENLYGQIRKIRSKFKTHKINTGFKDFNAKIAHGEILGIFGNYGLGKSKLI